MDSRTTTADQPFMWGTDFSRNCHQRDLPLERLVLVEQPEGRYYWAAYSKGKQKNGGFVVGFWENWLETVHVWQIIFGYGPLYIRDATEHTLYHKVDLFLSGRVNGRHEWYSPRDDH